jgi:hypothetical protein
VRYIKFSHHLLKRESLPNVIEKVYTKVYRKSRGIEHFFIFLRGENRKKGGESREG